MASAKGLLKNTFTVGAFTALSRVLGLVREMFQSRLVGAGVEQSAFTLAFALPNMARKLFGEGALTAAFVPVFKGEVESGNLESAARLARSVMTLVFLMLLALVSLALCGVGAIARFHELFGFEDSARLRLTLSLVTTLLPYMVFICGAAFGMGALNALGRFKASSFMPCLLNICWIGALGVLAFFPGMPAARRVKFVASAILAAGGVQMCFILFAMARAGVKPGLSFRGWADAKVRLVMRNLWIAAMGAGAIQINYMLDQFLAQKASPWAAGVIGYAERLMDLPLGIIGVAFGTVLLPTFAGFFAKNDYESAKNALSGSVKSLMFVMLPAAAGLFALAPEITSVIYEGGDFDALATKRVARALAIYATGLGFFGFMKSIVPWFQAQNDMKTPLHVSVWTVLLNASLNIAAVFCLPVEWRHVGLAASTVLCSAVGCTVLVALAIKKNGSLGLSSCIVPTAKIASASILMGVVVLWAKDVFQAFFVQLCGADGAICRIAALGTAIAVGASVYIFCAAALMPNELKAALRRFKKGK